MSRRPRVLLVGPLPREGSPIGGTQVSFSELVESFGHSGTFEVEVVDTTRAHSYGHPRRSRAADAAALARVVSTVLRRGPASDLVFFNASPGGALLGGPLVATACRSVGRPLVVRIFGGGFDAAYERAPGPLRKLVDTCVLGADLVLLQTDALCRRFAGATTVRKLPTTRRPPAQARVREGPCRRFLFLAQMRPEKGAAEAMRAIELAPAGCTLSVWGPLLPGTDLAAFQGGSRSRYHGEIAPARVPELCASHDALVFPSYWPGEGLPGVVIEAMQHGMAVIAARWRALPELVEHGKSGLLVEPRSSDAVARAMHTLASDSELYASLSRGALARGLEHSAAAWHPTLEGWLCELLGRAEPPAPLPVRAADVPLGEV